MPHSVMRDPTPNSHQGPGWSERSRHLLRAFSALVLIDGVAVAENHGGTDGQCQLDNEGVEPENVDDIHDLDASGVA